MKITIKSIAIILFLLQAMTAIAKEPIKGAFGFELGQIFDKKMAISDNLGDPDDFQMYYIEPVNPYDKFLVYMVTVTPVSNVILSIAAAGETKANSCSNEMDVLVSLLSKKYGELKKPDGFQVDPVKKITVGSRSIEVSCDIGYETSKLAINYVDSDLFLKGDKERIELKSKKVNKDGL